MKIAFPVDDKTIDSNVCISFGRTPYFLIYDTEKNEDVYIDNNAATSLGGAGIKAAQTIVDNKVDAIITPRCGENAAEVFKAAEVKIYKTINSVIKDNIKAFNQGKLELLSNIHSGFHNHGNK